MPAFDQQVRIVGFSNGAPQAVRADLRDAKRNLDCVLADAKWVALYAPQE